MKSLKMLPVLAVMAAHGAVTLDEGQTLELTQANAGNAEYADVTLNGGTLRFSGDGTINYTGNVKGNGTIEKKGTGYARFENAGVIGSDSVVDVQAGALEVGAFSGEMRVADGAMLNVGHRSVKAKKVRLFIRKTTSGNAGFEFSEVDLYLNGVNVPWPEGTTVTGYRVAGGNTSADYTPLTDNNPKTVVYADCYYKEEQPITWTFPNEIVLDGYSLWSSTKQIVGWGKDGSEITLNPGVKEDKKMNGTPMSDANFKSAEFYKFRIPADEESHGDSVIAGTAQTEGDLNVFADGGAYGASISVGGTLSIGGNDVFKLFVGDGTKEMKQTSFVFGECDADSIAKYRAAVPSAALAKGLTLDVFVDEDELSFRLSRKGTAILIR